LKLDKEFRHNIIPGGAHTYSRGDESFPLSAPEVLKRAKGAFTWSFEGRKYLDWAMSVRSVFIGHAFSPLDLSAYRASKKGVSLSRPSPEEFLLAERMQELIPSAQMVKFGKNGSDATAAAIRLARAATGRDFVLRSAEAPFLGVHDWFIGSTQMNAGVPESTKCLTDKFAYGDIESLSEKLESLRGQVAAVILEPLGFNVPSMNYLREVKKLVEYHGAILIFDEIVSGFRVTYGGYQNLVGVSPDLSTFGKAMANGYPISALVGRAEIMELGGVTHSSRRVFLMSSTYGPERSSIAAALYNLRFLRNSRHYLALEKRMANFITLFKRILEQHQLAPFFRFGGLPISPNIQLIGHDGSESLVRKTLLMDQMAKKGVLLGAHLFSPSLAHGNSEIKFTLKQLATTLADFHLDFKMPDGELDFKVDYKVKPVFRSHNF
jgi:glutamate-1-semialdehyde 2,1-aminomutase